jgi:hypothetical protein
MSWFSIQPGRVRLSVFQEVSPPSTSPRTGAARWHRLGIVGGLQASCARHVLHHDGRDAGNVFAHEAPGGTYDYFGRLVGRGVVTQTLALEEALRSPAVRYKATSNSGSLTVASKAVRKVSIRDIPSPTARRGDGEGH